ncbi:hypothetical protein U9M48_034702 [Paspalum notatum var. saurae]|uniref:Uncharacterized protein n=1 Tax=Paspalum notatum var. saurae TaxID=547442 RepID=A0AAQ3U9J2_PASNO
MGMGTDGGWRLEADSPTLSHCQWDPTAVPQRHLHLKGFNISHRLPSNITSTRTLHRTSRTPYNKLIGSNPPQQ